MSFVALNCPQCAAPLPRIAIWRSVKCASCGALITRGESVVARDSFRKALARARQSTGTGGNALQCGGQPYELLWLLGAGDVSQVYLGLRLGSLPLLATLKVSSKPEAAARYAREAEVLRALRSIEGENAAAYAAQRLPEVIASGPTDGSDGRHALVLRRPAGFWGSLAALNERFPEGTDPRHAVWIWRRMLDLLLFVHYQGWTHGGVSPEHALVHPRDHGVLLIGWHGARKTDDDREQARDLVRSARVVMVLLRGATDTDSFLARTPSGLANLILRSSEDLDFCRTNGAKGLDALLRQEARSAFGPPSFVPLIL